EYGPTEILTPVRAALARPARLCLPCSRYSPAHPRESPGVSTCGGGSPRETDWLLEGDGFELPVPREMTTIFEPSCFWFLENCSRSSRRDRWSGTASPPLASGSSVEGRVGQRQNAVEFGQGEHGSATGLRLAVSTR